MNFETGQRGFDIRELKRIQSGKGEWIVIYSNISGAPMTFAQGDLEIFKLRNGSLEKLNGTMLPLDIGLKDFVKTNTPDSVMNMYTSYSNHCYELIYYGDNINYVLHEDFDLYKIDKSWLLGNVIEFIFDKGRFKRQKAAFK